MSAPERDDRTIPVPIRRFVRGLMVVGAFAIAGSVALGWFVGPPPVGWFLMAVVLAALADVEFLAIRHGDSSNAFNCSEGALVFALVFIGPEWTPLAGTIGLVAHQHASGRARPKVLFNGAAYAVAASLASGAALAVGLAGGPQWVGIGAAAVTYFVTNLVLVGRVISRVSGLAFTSILGEGLALSLIVFVGNSAMAGLISLTAKTEALVLVIVPPLLAHLIVSFRNTRAVMSERDAWADVQAVSNHVQRCDADELPTVVLEALVRLLDADHAELVVVDPGTDLARRWTMTHHGLVTTDEGPVARVAGDEWTRVVEDRKAIVVPCPTHRGDAHRKNLFVAPLDLSTGPIGMLRVQRDDLVGVSERAMSVLTTLASQTSSALANHRLITELRHAADHDALTGLPNRTALLDHLSEALGEARDAGDHLAVLFFDLDRFKLVNDSLGHHAGDEILVTVGERLATMARAGRFAARFGGDEFVMVARSPDITEVLGLADEIVESMAEPFDVLGRLTSLSACVGIAVDDGETAPDAMLRDADAAMYDAKKDGLGSVRLFSATMREAAIARLEIDRELRKALDNCEIEVAFQPLVDLRSGRIVELEALARWRHARLGPVSPVEFIATAEESGLIHRLGALVLDVACREVHRWRRLGIGDPELRVAVNVSPLQIDHNLIDTVSSTLDRHGLPTDALCLEVTESALATHPDAIDVLRQLTLMGVGLALDDFGTGYSSLAVLRELPVDTLKIDRAFVLAVDTPDGAAMVSGIVSLAHTLGLDVVAEGIEDQRVADVLARLDCDLGQGWHFGRPADAVLTEAVLSSDVRSRVSAPTLRLESA